MPLPICKKLKLGEFKPTTISFQLADWLMKYPKEVLENISLKVSKFFISMDFVVFDIEEDIRIPVILRRPLLATARATLNVKNG